MGIAMSMLQTSVSNFKAQDKFTSDNSAFFTTHGSTELVMSDLWGRFNGQTSNTPVTNFVTFLNSNVTFSPIQSGSGDSIADDFRQGPPSYTPSSVTGASPSLDNPTKVYRSVLTSYNDIRLGDRFITGVRLYKKERPQPGQYLVDLLVVAETQKYIGNSASAQASLVSTMSAGQKAETLQPQFESQLFNFSSPPVFNGFDYALLTKNLTCTCCHMHVRSRDLLDNVAATLQTPPAPKTQFGNFNRVKVGITDFLGVRQGQMYSSIDGTLYHRGVLQYEGGHNNLTAANFQADTMWSAGFGSNSTNIAQDAATGNPAATPFVNQTTDSSGNTISTPAPNGNLYLFYANTNNGQTDGVLPTNNFPSPFPEIPNTTTLTTGQVINGPDNKINPNEVSAAMTGLYSLVNPQNPSTLTGGSAVTLAAGVQYNSVMLPSGSTPVSTSSGNVVPASANISGSYTGNVVVTGTTFNPIKIDGKVVIDGDVVIRGYVQGTGQLYATGNIYIPGDLIYNDVNVGTINEQFGRNSSTDPKTQNNLMAIVAGKNIVVGDYLSQVTHWNSSYDDFYTGYTYNSATNKVTPTSGTPEPGKKQTKTANNYVNPHQLDIMPTVSLPGVSLVSGILGGPALPSSTSWGGSNFANFTIEQLSYFNRNELMKVLTRLPTSDPTLASSYTGGAGVANPNYDPNYIPKFYSLYKYDPANPQTNPALAFIYNGSTYSINTSDPTDKGHWNGTDDPHVYEYMTSVDSLPSAALSDAAKQAKNVINIHPDWVTPQTMMKIISDEQFKHVNVAVDPQYGDPANGYVLPDRRLDGVLYTKNAIFAIERKQSQYFDASANKWTKMNAKSGGYMQVNGALVAPDTGILVTGDAANNFTNDKNNRQSFVVNYDNRVRSFMAMGNQDFNSFNLWGVTRVGMVRSSKTMPPAP
jgi:hypothetical protein